MQSSWETAEEPSSLASNALQRSAKGAWGHGLGIFNDWPFFMSLMCP